MRSQAAFAVAGPYKASEQLAVQPSAPTAEKAALRQDFALTSLGIEHAESLLVSRIPDAVEKALGGQTAWKGTADSEAVGMALACLEQGSLHAAG